MTQSLMRDSNNQRLLGTIHHYLLAGGPHTGVSNYKDKANPINFVMDGLGFLTGGALGHNFADSFTGSYQETWTAIRRSSHSATVYFTATNNSDLNSLVHPEIWSGGFVRSIDGILPWDAGPFSATYQTFQWQKTVNY